MLNDLSLMDTSDEIHRGATDLAWLGAPAFVAIHVASAARIGVDHFVTLDPVAASWAAVNGLNVVPLNAGGL